MCCRRGRAESTAAASPVDSPVDRPGYVPTWAALDERADDPAVAFVDGATGVSTSFHELHQRVMGIARGLSELGLRPGERVAMLVPPSVDLVAAVYAVWRAGGVTVIADRGLGLGGLGRAVRGARVDWVIGAPEALAAARALRWAPGAYRIATGPKPVMGAVATLDDLVRSAAVLPPAPLPDDPAAVLYTSGATGPAKGVRYRHHQLAAQRDALAATYGITRDDRLVAAFAPFALYGPALGIASTIPDVDVTKPGTLTAAALGDGVRIGRRDDRVRVAGRTRQRGAHLHRRRPAVRPRAPRAVGRCAGARRHAPRHRGADARGRAAHALRHDRVPAGGRHRRSRRSTRWGPAAACASGRPVPGAEVFVAPLGFDAATAVVAVPPGTTGEVLVRTPWLSDGYDRRWATERDARPLDAAGRRWHRSGDVGHVDADGLLWIEGRSVHVVHTDRGPVTPVPVEVAVERVDGIVRSAAVGVGPVGCQVLVVVVETGADADGLAPAAVAERGARCRVAARRRGAAGGHAPRRHPPQHQDRPHPRRHLGRARAVRRTGQATVVTDHPFVSATRSRCGSGSRNTLVGERHPQPVRVGLTERRGPT